MGLFDMFTGASAKDAAAKNAALFAQYGKDATGALDAGMAGSLPAANNAIGAYTPLSDLGRKYGGATSLALDSYGVNGADGNARAVDAFHASPGYQWNVDQNTDQVARKAASLGVAASGNTLAGIQDRAHHLADQEYGGWRTGLSSFVNPELGATGGAASGTAAGYKNLSDLWQTDATNRTGVYGNVASGTANSNNQSAQAQMNASSNFWSGLASLGGNIAGGYFGTARKAA